MGPLSGNTLRVQILGKDYELDPGGLTPLEASQLASYVDQKMREISEKLGIVDTQKIAVLAALNIAFELAPQRPSPQTLSHEDEVKTKRILSSLEKILS
jgi:cell division protein ZapA